MSLWLVVLLCMSPLAVAEAVYDFSVLKLDGKEMSLATLKGKVLLIVNLARDSDLNEQIASLNSVAKAYEGSGLVVIGVPCGDFGAEEPGSDADIQRAYESFHPDFLVTRKASVRGKDQIPLYGFLTAAKDATLQGEVHWNFTKFVVDRTGQVVARFEPEVDPASFSMKSVLERVLAGKPPGLEKPKDEPGPAQDEVGDTDN